MCLRAWLKSKQQSAFTKYIREAVVNKMLGNFNTFLFVIRYTAIDLVYNKIIYMQLRRTISYSLFQ